MESTVMCAAEIKSGALVVLLPNYRFESVEVHAVFPRGPHPSAKVRAFVDYIAATLANIA
jgi:DNA-binding transcriptional LysR family regulator